MDLELDEADVAAKIVDPSLLMPPSLPMQDRESHLAAPEGPAPSPGYHPRSIMLEQPGAILVSYGLATTAWPCASASDNCGSGASSISRWIA